MKPEPALGPAQCSGHINPSQTPPVPQPPFWNFMSSSWWSCPLLISTILSWSLLSCPHVPMNSSHSHPPLPVPIIPSSPYHPLMISIHPYCIPLLPHDLQHTFLVPMTLTWSLLSCPSLHNPFCSPHLSLSLGPHQNIQVPFVPSRSSLLSPSPHHLLLVPITPS